MHEKGCAPGDIGLEQVHAGIGCIPALDHDIVQLVAQKLIDHALVLSLDFEEVRQRSKQLQIA